MVTKTVNVSNSSQLSAALTAAKTATSPETIDLAPGTYTRLSLFNYKFTNTVTIQSANSKNEAVLQGMTLIDSSNLAFNNLQISGSATPISTFGAEATYVGAFDNDTSLTFSHLTAVGVIRGTLANTPSGFDFENCSNVGINNSTFTDLHFAIDYQGMNGLDVVGNQFSFLFDDGIRGGGVSNELIEDNTFTSMHMDASDPDHPDAIQLWTTDDTTSESNISIIGNTYTRGDGNPIQGIFVTDQVGDLPYVNLTIEDNHISGSSFNGIWVDDAKNLTLSGNTLTPYAGQEVFLNLQDIYSGTVKDNAFGSELQELGFVDVSFSGNRSAAAIPIPTATALSSAIASIAAPASSATDSLTSATAPTALTLATPA
jgi:parallel beta-helix repeat protein